MNTSTHCGQKHTPSVKSAAIIVFPLECARRRAAPRLSDATVSATEELQCEIVLLRRGHAAESVNRLLHLRILQAAVLALKLRGKIPSKWAPDDGCTGPLTR
jgi:hypothetical protein